MLIAEIHELCLLRQLGDFLAQKFRKKCLVCKEALQRNRYLRLQNVIYQRMKHTRILKGLILILTTLALTSCQLRGSKGTMPIPQEVAAAADSATAVDASVLDSLTVVVTPDSLSAVLLQRVGYVVSYNPEMRIPNWVAWHLTPQRLEGSASRKGHPFQTDEDIPEPRVDTYDYMRSGYDRGHMCPAADNKWDAEAMRQSFLLTNICPQNHNLNAGDWNEMEMQCRAWAKNWGGVYIVCGPLLYRCQHKRIGEHKVVVPEAFFKVVLCLKGTPKAIGFIYKNEKGNRPKGDYVNTIDEVERLTGFDFFSALPDSLENKIEATANLEDWY